MRYKMQKLREKKGLYGNALAMGACRFPKLPGNAAQN